MRVPAAQAALAQMDARNVTLEPEYYADVDPARFARVKPLLWLWYSFDRTPLGGQHVELGVRLRRLLSALRLYDTTPVAYGPLAWTRTGGSPWQPFALGALGRREERTLVVGVEQEDELRAFCSLIARRIFCKRRTLVRRIASMRRRSLRLAVMPASVAYVRASAVRSWSSSSTRIAAAVGEDVVEQHRIETSYRQIAIRVHVIIVRNGDEPVRLLRLEQQIVGDRSAERTDPASAEI